MTLIRPVHLVLIMTSSYLISGCHYPPSARTRTTSATSGQAGSAGPGMQSGMPIQGVVIKGNVNLPGVMLGGLPGNPTSDAAGSYHAMVEPNWTGEVTPRLDGYQFWPTARRYTHLVSSVEGQDYLAARLAFPIAGSVGAEGVVMRGLPGPTITGADGCYKALVEHGWTGTVEPTKEGYTFEPPRRHYDPVTKEWIHENYAARSGVALGARGMRHTSTARDVNEAETGSPAAESLPVRPDRVAQQALVPAPRLLILPAEHGKMSNLDEVEEDLLVMSTILLEALQGSGSRVATSDPNLETAVPVPHPSLQALFIQDYGVVFSAWMRSSPPRADLSEPSRDPVWEQARQYVLGATGRGHVMVPPHRTLRQGLPVGLISSLRHAANIRHLGPEQWVVVQLTWDDPGPAPASPTAMWPGHGEVRAATLRVRKGHVDSFLGGALDERQFKQAVQVLVQ